MIIYISDKERDDVALALDDLEAVDTLLWELRELGVDFSWRLDRGIVVHGATVTGLGVALTARGHQVFEVGS